MSKIPPRDWPKYNSERECTACGSTETEDWFFPAADDTENEGLGAHVQRKCHNCRLARYERPLDFDFEKWAVIWKYEGKLEIAQKLLAEARKAVE